MMDIRECIPETVPRSGTKPVQGTSRTSKAAHYVLPLWNVVGNRYRDIPIGPCDWLRIESPIPLIVFADGERIAIDPEQQALDFTGNDFSLRLMPGATGFDSTTQFRPGYSFTIQREIRNISIFAKVEIPPIDYGDPVVLDIDDLNFGGAVHLYVGSNAVRDVGPPLYVDHEVGASVAGLAGATSGRIEPIRPTLHGNNAASANGIRWIPSVVHIVGISVNVTWSAAPGVITSVQFGQLTTPPAFRNIRSYNANSSPFYLEFQHPIRIENYTTRLHTVSDRGALVVVVGASAGMSSASVGLHCRSEM